jgi:alcohol dehydrogenase
MRRLMELVLHRRIDLTPLLTHSFAFDQIVDAYTLFKEQRDDVLKVLIKTVSAHT